MTHMLSLLPKSRFEESGVEIPGGLAFLADYRPDAIAEASAGIEGLFMPPSHPRLDADLLARLGSVRIIQTAGAGFDSVDHAAAAKLGLIVCNSPARLAERGENGGRDVQPPLSRASGKKSPLDNSGEKSRIKARAVSNSSLFFTTQAMPRPCWSISTQSRACVASPARATCIRPALKRAISVITSVYTKVPRQPLNVIPKITWNQ